MTLLTRLRTVPALRHASRSHWTGRYLGDRVRLALYEWLHPDEPWLVSDMVRFLELWLKPTDVAFEWGSGASTYWIAQRVARLASVETDPVWYRKVGSELESRGLGEKARVFLRREEDALYPEIPGDLSSSGLDFCLVDGARRDECAFCAARHIRSGGILVVDNVNWFLPKNPPSRAPNSRRGEDYASSLWRDFAAEVSGWRCIWVTNGVTDTAAWIRS